MAYQSLDSGDDTEDEVGIQSAADINNNNVIANTTDENELQSFVDQKINESNDYVDRMFASGSDTEPDLKDIVLHDFTKEKNQDDEKHTDKSIEEQRYKRKRLASALEAARERTELNKKSVVRQPPRKRRNFVPEPIQSDTKYPNADEDDNEIQSDTKHAKTNEQVTKLRSELADERITRYTKEAELEKANKMLANMKQGRKRESYIKELRDRLKAHQKANREYKNKLSIAQAANRDNENSIIQLKTKQKQLEKNLETQVKQTKRIIGIKDKMKVARQNELLKHDEQVTELQKNLGDRDSKIQSLQQKHDQKDEQLQIYKTTIQKLETELEECNGFVKENIQLKEVVQQLEARLKVKVESPDCTDIENELKNTKAELVKTRGELRSISQENDSVWEENEKKRQKIDLLLEDKKRLEDEVKRLSGMTESYEDELKDVHQTDIVRLEEGNKKLKAEVKDNQKKIGQLVKTINRYSEKETKLNTKITKLQEQLASQTTRSGDKRSGLELKITQLELKLKASLDRNKELQNEIKAMENDLKIEEKESVRIIKGLEKELKQANSEKNKVESQYSRFVASSQKKHVKHEEMIANLKQKIQAKTERKKLTVTDFQKRYSIEVRNYLDTLMGPDAGDILKRKAPSKLEKSEFWGGSLLRIRDYVTRSTKIIAGQLDTGAISERINQTIASVYNKITAIYRADDKKVAGFVDWDYIPPLTALIRYKQGDSKSLGDVAYIKDRMHVLMKKDHVSDEYYLPLDIRSIIMALAKMKLTANEAITIFTIAQRQVLDILRRLPATNQGKPSDLIYCTIDGNTPTPSEENVLYLTPDEVIDRSHVSPIEIVHCKDIDAAGALIGQGDNKVYDDNSLDSKHNNPLNKDRLWEENTCLILIVDQETASQIKNSALINSRPSQSNHVYIISLPKNRKYELSLFLHNISLLSLAKPALTGFMGKLFKEKTSNLKHKGSNVHLLEEEWNPQQTNMIYYKFKQTIEELALNQVNGYSVFGTGLNHGIIEYMAK